MSESDKQFQNQVERSDLFNNETRDPKARDAKEFQPRAASMPNLSDRLLTLRAMNPFLPIAQLPPSCNAVVLAANVAQDVPVPSGAKYVIFGSDSGLVAIYASLQGRAQVPAGPITDGTAPFIVGGVNVPYMPIFYCEGMSSISLVSQGAAIVTCGFYFQQ